MIQDLINVPFTYSWWLLPLTIWVIYWKGMALWKASHRESKIWFIALLVINTLGLLEILYIYVFSEKKMFVKVTDKKEEPENKESENKEEKSE